jgi:hypothetical protein
MSDYFSLQIWKATRAKLGYLQSLYLKRGRAFSLVELVEMLVNQEIVKLEEETPQ